MKTITCCLCNKREKLRWSASTNAELEFHKLCFNCNFWREKTFIKDHPTVARIDGEHYQIEPEDKTSNMFRGFGGSKFHIKFHDGREVTTTNLWCQGRIPEHFKAQLPDNATFVQPSQYNYQD